MTGPATGVAPSDAATRRTRRRLVLIAVIGLAPIVLSYLTYYTRPRDARVNYGELIVSEPPPQIAGRRLDGAPFDIADLRGRWVILHSAPGDCNGDCEGALYATRQARTIQNAERERIVRVWLVTGGAPPAAKTLAEHPDLTVVLGATPAAPLPRGGDAIYLVDPLGNFVLAWPSKPDIKAMARDVGRLLGASSIG